MCLVNILGSFARIRHKFSPSLHLFQSLGAKILSIHTPIQHLLSIQYVSDTASGSGDRAVNKRVENSCPHSGIPSKLFRLLIFNRREMKLEECPADCPKPHDFPQIPYHISLYHAVLIMSKRCICLSNELTQKQCGHINIPPVSI